MKLKKILILCYDFPPFPSVGALRPYSWYKYFKNQGFYPIVLTRNWKNNIYSSYEYYEKDNNTINFIEDKHGKIIRLPYKGNIKSKLLTTKNPLLILFRKFITFFESFLKWYFPIFDDKYFIYSYLKKNIKQLEVDLIIATGEPFILFKYAYKISTAYKIPWIGDYRDGWYSNHNKKSFLWEKILNFEYYFERKYLKSMSFYISASKNIIIKNNKSGLINHGFEHLNGIDLEVLNQLKKNQKNSKNFTITFTGTIYDKHNIIRFFDSYIELVEQEKYADLKLILVGIELRPSKYHDFIKNKEKLYPQNIKILKAVSYKESISIQLQSTILLKFDFTGQQNGLLGAKLYEYAATRKPILTVLSIDNKKSTFFADRDFQKMVYTKEEIKNNIISLYNEFIVNQDLKTNITNEEIYSFSRLKNIVDLSVKINNHFNW